MQNAQNLEMLQKLMRAWIIEMSTTAGSGHPTSSLSATEALSVLMFGRGQDGVDESAFFHYDPMQPERAENDRLIFSKGHASPLYYALWAAAGLVPEDELMTFRRFESTLEGHPTRRFPFTEVPTGSLGQGLSVGVGEALALRAQESNARVFVLLGDSEMAEGQVYEAMQLAAHYKLSRLTAIVDVNRLGQRGQTMLGHNVAAYRARAEAFGWHAIVVDGHDNAALAAAYAGAAAQTQKPTMIIAQTEKGHGVSFLADKEGWHGKALSQEECAQAVAEFGEIDRSARGALAMPADATTIKCGGADCACACDCCDDDAHTDGLDVPVYEVGQSVAPRVAYGAALAALAEADAAVVALDAETSNSTKADAVKKETPQQFYEMFIAEQNMASAAVGMARRGMRPFVSTFAAFLTRAADQIRMAQYAGVDVTFVGSHAGVSIGADGASQMGLEDMALFTGLRESTVLYPSDATSASMCTVLASMCEGVSYVRTTRADLPVLYGDDVEFGVSGSHTLRSSQQDSVTILAAGITVHEALAAADVLAADGVHARVIDCYSIRPLDEETVRAAAEETGRVIVVEDHHEVGGLGSEVYMVLSGMDVEVTHLCVREAPRSGTPAELLAHEEIDAAAIVAAAKVA